MPWWAAILIAITGTGIGFAFDAGSGNKELTIVFAASYVAGCLAAVLAVRQSGVFTAVIQPPLLLFCAVPGAYWLFHGAKIGGVKDILINCGYPLIERFPLMVFTSAGVLLIGIIRWYLESPTRGRGAADNDAEAHGDGAPAATRSSGSGAKLAASLGRGGPDEDDTPASKTTRRVRQVSESPKRARSGRNARSNSSRSTDRRSTPARSRSARSPLDDATEPGSDRVRRRRPRPIHDVDVDAEPPAGPRRRPRPVREPELRSQPPREIRRDPHTRYGRPATRGSRFDPYEPVEPYDLPPRRRPASESAVSRPNSTHHPISQVRYRGAGRSRSAQSSAAESWDDI